MVGMTRGQDDDDDDDDDHAGLAIQSVNLDLYNQ